ncbi:hypothetical protein BC567DRAFT_222063 [Phyllosticta citribraziliensis]
MDSNSLQPAMPVPAHGHGQKRSRSLPSGGTRIPPVSTYRLGAKNTPQGTARLKQQGI